MRNPLLSLLLATALAGVAPPARATSVVPPSFPELVAEADAIYRGRVTAIESRHVERAEGGPRVIKTFVTLAVQRVLKGPEQNEVVLEFLGGTIGEESLVVSGMPKFALGDREFVFVQKNGVQFCPLVALTHGRYRVKSDGSGRDIVTRDNGLPLTDTAQVAQPMQALPANIRAATAARTSGDALTPATFEANIAAELKQTPALQQRLN